MARQLYQLNTKLKVKPEKGVGVGLLTLVCYRRFHLYRCMDANNNNNTASHPKDPEFNSSLKTKQLRGCLFQTVKGNDGYAPLGIKQGSAKWIYRAMKR